MTKDEAAKLLAEILSDKNNIQTKWIECLYGQDVYEMYIDAINGDDLRKMKQAVKVVLNDE